MERILKMKKRFEPLPVALSFCDSKLYIGIPIFYDTKVSRESRLPADNNFFGYRGGKVSLDELEKIYKKIKSFVSIVDDLNLTLRIWSKE